MAQGVTLLKELLFETEQRELSEVTRRVEEIYARAGSDERLKSSVAQVLDGALRQAEEERHDHLAEAMAPAVVQTIKNEIHNSRDAMVEALYPITGRLVAAYVANAFKELMDKINARLEGGFSMHAASLRLRSWLTGQPVAELALAGIQRLDVEELYLIRRGSGELIDRWQRPAANGSALPRPDELARGANRDTVVAGFLAAINDFASEAFDADKSGLQTLDLQTHRIYLRASPSYLLAAKCSGPAPAGAERQLDTEFLSALERHRDLLAGPPAPARGTSTPNLAGKQLEQLHGILPQLASSLQSPETGPQPGAASRRGGRIMLGLLGSIGMALVAVWLWVTWDGMQIAGMRRSAQMIVDSSSDFKGWPVSVESERDGSAVSLIGLAPSEDAKKDLLAAVGRTVAPASVKDGLSVVHSAPPGREAGLEVIALRKDVAGLEVSLLHSHVRRSIQRAERRLMLALADVARIEQGPARPQGQSLDRARGEMEHARELMLRLQRVLAASGLKADDFKSLPAPLLDISTALARAEAEFHLAIGSGGEAPPAAPEPADAPAADPLVAAENVAFASERLAERTAWLDRQAGLERRMAMSQRQWLEAWTKANAVFFGNETDFRDAARTEKLLDELAARMKTNSLRLRVVGYTDGLGSAARNSPLAATRAEKVAAALVGRGIDRARLSVIGRVNGPDLSPDLGPDSPNRRVEFELAFDGEGASPGPP